MLERGKARLRRSHRLQRRQDKPIPTLVARVRAHRHTRPLGVRYAAAHRDDVDGPQ